MVVQRELVTAGQQLDATLLRSHQAELAQRQAAAGALNQYFQNQQLTNSLSRASSARTAATVHVLLSGGVKDNDNLGGGHDRAAG